MVEKAVYTVLANGQPASDCPYCSKRHPHEKGSEGSEVRALCSTKEERAYVLAEERPVADGDRRRA